MAEEERSVAGPAIGIGSCCSFDVCFVASDCPVGADLAGCEMGAGISEDVALEHVNKVKLEPRRVTHGKYVYGTHD